MSAPLRVAAVQMVSGADIRQNLLDAERLVAEAAARGARLVALPEYFPLISPDETAKVRAREHDGAGPLQDFLGETARRHQVWLVGGSIPLAAAAPDKVRNSCLVFDDGGRRVARYDKIHLFAFERGAERYDEAETIEPGGVPLAVDSPFGRLGLSVCYDVRFPELYRRERDVAAWFVPSAFTATTGAAHWETLLRARAIETQCYVVAPAQGGLHPNGRRTHGHTLIVDPWGDIVAERAEGEGVIFADVDAARLSEVRKSLPALHHRRL